VRPGIFINVTTAGTSGVLRSSRGKARGIAILTEDFDLIPLTSDPIEIVHSGRVPTHKDDDRIALLQGTLDLLILRILVLGSHHGQGIARTIQRQSEETFFVDHGSLYLALQRLEDKGWIQAKWGVSENNRKARFYSLTKKGREQLNQKTSQWRRLSAAIARILGPEESEV
jgi:PadR family transcriptional regulator, regulatory protein PadR